MPNQNLQGKTFALYSCKAWTERNNQETRISGLYTVEDFVYPDRTCGQFEGGYWVFSADDESGEATMYFVDDYTFMEQTNPKSHGRMLVQEREMEFAGEDFDNKFGDLFTVDHDPSDKPF